MELNNQVVNKELSQKIKKLGVKQESLFYWYVYKKSISLVYVGKYSTHTVYGLDSNDKPKIISAFTVAELGEKLNLVKEGYILESMQYLGFPYIIRYCKNSKCLFEIIEDTEANARAKLLIYLLENKLIEEY